MTTIAIGAFDGIHRGHASVISSALELDSDATVVCFEPIPRQFFGGGGWNSRLTTAYERRRAIADLGASSTLTVPFDRHTASMSATEFLEDLRASLGFRRVVVGYDFHFGHKRSGSCGMLARWCTSRGIDSIIVRPLEIGGAPVKSERIRRLLGTGDIEGSGRLLGRSYKAFGVCSRGRGIGRELGFPTLNIRVPACKMIPPRGSYAGLVDLQGVGSGIPAAIFVPGGPTGPVEAHLLRPLGDSYGRTAGVEFVRKLREAVPAPDFKELRELISADVKEVEKMLGSKEENRMEGS